MSCGGYHKPDQQDTWVDYEGWRFHPPFKCMCCGKEICARQFAYGRCCGSCDIGACNPKNMAYRVSAVHPYPAWYAPSLKRNEQINEFAIALGNATRL